MGSETVAVGDEKTDELDFLAALTFLRPQRQIMAIVRSMPKTRPGKKPARTAVTGKLLQCAVVNVVFCGEEVGVLVALAVVAFVLPVVVDVGFEVERVLEAVLETLAVEDDVATNTQSLF